MIIFKNARGISASIGLALVGSVWSLHATANSHDPRQIPGYPLQIQAYDAREVAPLPVYCKYTQDFTRRLPEGDNAAERSRWYQIQGPIFHAMHHYCWGLMYARRATLVTNSQGRRHYLENSINEFDYVIERAPEDFVLLPEILTKKGESLLRLGRGPAAATELTRAMKLKPDYWPPYVALSDFYKEVGNVAQARELLQAGLAHSPNSKPLQRRLAELDLPKKPQSKH